MHWKRWWCAQVMTQAGEDVREEVWKSFIVLLTNAPELHAYAARCLYRALRQHVATAQTSLLATATWYTGERPPGRSALREAERCPVPVLKVISLLSHALCIFKEWNTLETPIGRVPAQTCVAKIACCR